MGYLSSGKVQKEDKIRIQAFDGKLIVIIPLVPLAAYLISKCEKHIRCHTILPICCLTLIVQFTFLAQKAILIY